MAKQSGNKKPKTNSFMLLEKGPKWKREQVADHKFDFIDVDEFYDPSCFTKMKYMMIFLSVIKSTLTYLADLWTAGILLSSVVRHSYPILQSHKPFLPQHLNLNCSRM
jgi:hypothetical protein